MYVAVSIPRLFWRHGGSAGGTNRLPNYRERREREKESYCQRQTGEGRGTEKAQGERAGDGGDMTATRSWRCAAEEYNA